MSPTFLSHASKVMNAERFRKTGILRTMKPRSGAQTSRLVKGEKLDNALSFKAGWHPRI